MKLYRRNLAEVWKVLREIQDEQKRQHSAVQGQEAGELRRSENFRQLERDSKQPESDPSQTSQAESNDGVPTESCVTSNDSETLTMPSQIQRHVSVDKEIFVAGGPNELSCEIFNLSTQKWSLHQDMLFFSNGLCSRTHCSTTILTDFRFFMITRLCFVVETIRTE